MIKPPLNVRHVNPHALMRGLVPQRKTRIDRNEFGLRERRRTFLCFDHLYEKFDPVDEPARPHYRDVDFPNNLFAVTSAFSDSAVSPGVGLLEVLYRGAFFAENDQEASTTPYTLKNYVKDAVTVGIFKDVSADAYSGTWGLVGAADIEYYAIERHFQYCSHGEVTVPRFASEPYTIDDDHPAPAIENIDRRHKATAWNLQGNGINPFTGLSDNVVENWQPAIVAAGTAFDGVTANMKAEVSVTDFRVEPAGEFFQVLETGTVKLKKIYADDLAVYQSA